MVFVEPLSADRLRLDHGFECPSAQEGVSEVAIETLVVGILPGTPGVDVVGVDLIACEPGPDAVRDEFKAIVAPQTNGPAMMPDHQRQDLGYIGGHQTEPTSQGKTGAIKLIYHSQELEPAAIARSRSSRHGPDTRPDGRAASIAPRPAFYGTW